MTISLIRLDYFADLLVLQMLRSATRATSRNTADYQKFTTEKILSVTKMCHHFYRYLFCSANPGMPAGPMQTTLNDE